MSSMSSPAPLSDQVAANVRAEMAVQRRTAVELAELLGIGHRAALRRVNGDLDLSLNELSRVADWLGVTRSYLLRDRAAVAS